MLNNSYAIYRSEDLVTWTLLSANIAPQLTGPPGVAEFVGEHWRPKILFNNQTKLFVLWYNYGPFINGHYKVPQQMGVAVSRTLTGPYEVVRNTLDFKLISNATGNCEQFPTCPSCPAGAVVRRSFHDICCLSYFERSH